MHALMRLQLDHAKTGKFVLHDVIAKVSAFADKAKVLSVPLDGDLLSYNNIHTQSNNCKFRITQYCHQALINKLFSKLLNVCPFLYVRSPEGHILP